MEGMFGTAHLLAAVIVVFPFCFIAWLVKGKRSPSKG